jgi:hypothetical protein
MIYEKVVAENVLLNYGKKTSMNALENNETVLYNIYFNMIFHSESHISCSNISLIIKNMVG